MSAEPYDLLDRDARRRQLIIGRIGVLPPGKTLYWRPTAAASKPGLIVSAPIRTDLSDVFAVRIEKRTAGVLHEMPTIVYLCVVL